MALQDLALIVGPTEFAEVDGDTMTVTLWVEHEDGSLSIMMVTTL